VLKATQEAIMLQAPPRTDAAPSPARSSSTTLGRLAVVDDDPHLVRLVRRNLELAGYQVLTATDGQGALALIEAEDPDLLVLDLNMPVRDGWQTLTRLREFTTLPVIILSARDDEADIVRGLEAGADDYVHKPFSPRELVARIQGVLRRASFAGDERPAAVTRNGPLTVDYAEHRATLAGRELQLTPTEYRLLACLAQKLGIILPQEAILLRVWGRGYEQESHMLRVNIARLRAKLGESATAPRFVVTRPGVGYFMPRLSQGPA
jgi:DNA-binding response OmpR family regulator